MVFNTDLEAAMYGKAVETIKKYNMLSFGDKIVVGLSGGADSCALVHLLSSLRKEFGITVLAIHVNHGIRGAEAQRDEEFAKDFCRRLDIGFKAFYCDIPAEAVKRGLGEEETGRLVRYEKFREAVMQTGADKIAVAHNLNDCTETFLMNLCRGAGLKGLSGIKPVSGNIIRPLINCSRAEIERYCADNRIGFCTDSTNLQNEYTRNKIRNILIPWLKNNINSSADLNIAKTSELLKEEEDYLEGIAYDKYKASVVKSETGLTILNTDCIVNEPAVIRNRVMRIALRELRPDLRDFSRVHIESADSILMGGIGRKINLPGNITVLKSYEGLELYRGKRDYLGFCYDIRIGEKYFIKELDKFVLLSLNQEKNIGNCVNMCTKRIDYDKIKGKIQLRTRQAGDTIGIKNGRKKIKDLFIDEKISADERVKIPLLACGNSVILAGDRLGMDYYIQDSTKNVLYIYIWEDVYNG